MRAIQIRSVGGPEVMQMREVSDPSPGRGQVVVKVYAAGVNPVDTYIRSGTYPLELKFPFTPGFDGAGTIDSIGPDVEGFKKGDRVYLSGTLSGSYAELALCRSSQVHLLPDNVSFAQGAAIYVPYATAYRALFQRAHAVAGETVLVHGASGGVGIAAVQIGVAAGLKIIGTAGTEQGRKLVKEMGAHFVVDHFKKGYLDEIIDFSKKMGVDVVLEMLANVNLNHDLNLLAQEGRVVVIGSRGTVEIDPRVTMSKDGHIMGMSLLTVSEKDLRVIHSALEAGLKNRTLNPVIGKEFPLEKAPESHKAVMEPGAYGKIILSTDKLNR